MDIWQPRLAVIRNNELIALVLEFAGGDDRVLARFCFVGRHIWLHQREWIRVTHYLYAQWIEYVDDSLEDAIRAREIGDELDLRDFLSGDFNICICNAVSRGWASRCEACEGFEWD